MSKSDTILSKTISLDYIVKALILLLCLPINLSATKIETITSDTSITLRTLYVDDFSAILGNDQAVDSLLTFAQSHDINSLLLYDLHIVHAMHSLTNISTNGILADFIAKAKNDFNIVQIGATAENANFFSQVIDVYNNTRSQSSEKFDIYNLEFEFWNDGPVNPGGYYCNTYLIPNGLPCNNTGAFDYFISVLQDMNDLANANTHPISVEAYVGWLTASQVLSIADNLDRVRVHAYVSNPSTAFDYTEIRLMDFANTNINISIIYSAEIVFMQGWLETNGLEAAEQAFLVDWSMSTLAGNTNITLEEFTYFAYTDMLEIPSEVCPNINIIKDLVVDNDTTIFAKCLIDISNLTILSTNHLTLIAPEVRLSPDCTMLPGASLNTANTGCID